jgi:hypothetical protein
MSRHTTTYQQVPDCLSLPRSCDQGIRYPGVRRGARSRTDSVRMQLNRPRAGPHSRLSPVGKGWRVPVRMSRRRLPRPEKRPWMRLQDTPLAVTLRPKRVAQGAGHSAGRPTRPAASQSRRSSASATAAAAMRMWRLCSLIRASFACAPRQSGGQALGLL